MRLKDRTVFDRDSKVVDMSKRCVTDMKGNQRTILQKNLTVKDEAKINAREENLTN